MAETDMLLERHPKLSRLKKLPELGEAVKKHLAYKKNQPHAIYRRMANECMKIYCGGINVIAEVEQVRIVYFLNIIKITLFKYPIHYSSNQSLNSLLHLTFILSAV